VLFRGNKTVKMDPKGRLKLPSPIPDRLRKQYGEDSGYFVTSLDERTVLIYALSEWERIENSISQAPQFDELPNRFLTIAGHWGDEATLDAQDRMLIPAKLREGLGIDGEVTLVCHPNRIELHSAAAYQAVVAQSKLGPADFPRLKELGI